MEINRKHLLDVIENGLSKTTELECQILDLDAAKFSNILKYLHNKYHQRVEKQDVTLDINQNTHRLSIVGAEQIELYCHGDYDNLDKQSLISLQKTQQKKHHDRENRFSFNSKSEIPGKGVEQLLSDMQGKNKWFRLKKRVSVDDGEFRYDATIVKEGPGYNVTDMLSKNKEQIYEFEIEYIKTKSGKPDAILDGFLDRISIFLQIVNSTYGYLTTDNQKNNVLQKYHTALNSLQVEERNINERPLIGPQITTIQQKHVSKSKFAFETIYNDYTVTDKADGFRGILLIDNENNAYIINSKKNVIQLGIKYGGERLNKMTLIDSEVLWPVDEDDKVYILCFDIYLEYGENVSKLPLISNGNDRYSKLKTFLEKGFVKEADTIKNEIVIVPKIYKHGDILAESKTILDNYDSRNENLVSYKGLKYKIDGLIFTPKSLGVGAMNKIDNSKLFGTWGKLLKWKPPEENTIDFRVEFQELLDGNQVIDLFVARNSNKPITPHMYALKQRGTKQDDSHELFDKMYCAINNGTISCKSGQIINNGSVVECYLEDNQWKPMRLRTDKSKGNHVSIAIDIRHSIDFPVLKEHITGALAIEDVLEIDTNIYFNRKKVNQQFLSAPLMHYHREVKGLLLNNVVNQGNAKTLFDIACGKFGELHRWIETKNLDLIVGIDKIKDNLENSQDGAYQRTLDKNIKNKTIIAAAFDATKDLRAFVDDAIDYDEHSELLKALWGTKTSDGALKKYNNLATKQFDSVSCQFAMHYFLGNETSARNFVKNVSDNLKTDGYFFGCCFDGKLVNELFKREKETFVKRVQNDQPIWALHKLYDDFDEDDEMKNFGKEINVWVESINKWNKEYLVDFKLITKLFAEHGIYTVDTNEFQLKGPNFEDITSGYGNMSPDQQEYSKLNRWIIMKKQIKTKDEPVLQEKKRRGRPKKSDVKS